MFLRTHAQKHPAYPGLTARNKGSLLNKPNKVQFSATKKHLALPAAATLMAALGFSAPKPAMSAEAQLKTGTPAHELACPPAQVPQGEEQRLYFNDHAKLLSPKIIEELLPSIRQADIDKIATMVVWTLSQTDRELAELAPELMNKCRIGDGKKHNGVGIFVNGQNVKNQAADNRIFIATGDGIEGTLPDILIGRLLDEQVVPAFKQGQYDIALKNMTTEVLKIVKKDPEALKKYGVSGKDEALNKILIWATAIVGLFCLIVAVKRATGTPMRDAIWETLELFLNIIAAAGRGKGSSGRSGGGHSSGGGSGR